VAVMDCVVGVAWGGVGIWAIGFGEKCPAGGFEGYWQVPALLYSTCVQPHERPQTDEYDVEETVTCTIQGWPLPSFFPCPSSPP
jgi:hypothetical protein